MGSNRTLRWSHWPQVKARRTDKGGMGTPKPKNFEQPKQRERRILGRRIVEAGTHKLDEASKSAQISFGGLKLASFFVFSACGGIRSGSKLPVLTAYFPVLAQGILGKGELIVTPPLEYRLTGLAGLFYPSWNRSYGFTAYRYKCCRLSSTGLTRTCSGHRKIIRNSEKKILGVFKN